MTSIGIIRETKTPIDRRVALTPNQCAFLLQKYPGLSISIEHCPNRSYSDQEYVDQNVKVVESAQHCDYLFGIKEAELARKIRTMTSIGIIRETKTPIDRRVALTPNQCAFLLQKYPGLSISIEHCPNRSYSDQEYVDQNVKVVESAQHCDYLFGIKEVKPAALLPGKHYFFFSHTHKFQPYNLGLIRTVVDKSVRLTDYECLTDLRGFRLLGFGRFAGIVGTYNAFRTFGTKEGTFRLKPASSCFDLVELEEQLSVISLPPNLKIVVTGKGRVGRGIVEILNKVPSLTQVSSHDYLENSFTGPVYTWIDADEYVVRKDGQRFEFSHFFERPEMYDPDFEKYIRVSDVFIAGHFWDNVSPRFFDISDISNDWFKVSLIADISCDIASAIPTTIRSSTISDPVYDIDRNTGLEMPAYSSKNNITVMAVDNLPCELPRDASKDFGDNLVEKILPLLLENDTDMVIERGTIADDGYLKPNFSYMQDWVAGKGKL
eukprot:TRINITY_DN7747_c0_g2_i1.p1 TRINITY_DN7747_c0_g2~~TRINITY_DN7747_c0_g2_i1.p1  ORF type:complete len:507 (+),score=73.84 TRINITY_DN7747_c0_g2_i1:50-1522(+)